MSRTGTAKLANQAWESLLGAHVTLMKEFAEQPIWNELSVREYDVLYTLSKCDAPISQSELHRHVLMTQPALSRMVDRLVKRRLVLRTRDDADRRSMRLSLTESGRALQRRVGGRHAADITRTLSGRLSTQEMRLLLELTKKLQQSPTTQDLET